MLDQQLVQGNILRAFRHDHQAYVFLSFDSRRDAARQWLGGVAGRVAATDDTRGADPLLNVGLTATGLVLLHPGTAGHLAGYDAFWRGPLGLRSDDTGRVTTTPALLGDVGASDPRHWTIGGPGTPVDALLTIAAPDPQARAAAVRREREEAERLGLSVLSVQLGDALHLDDNPKQRAEHFGFADGLSQPGIRGYWSRPGQPDIAVGEFLLGHPGERRPVTWTPRPTPAAWMHNGSFQVFRRLTQDVALWRARLGAPDSPASARAMGRRPDGTPLSPGARGANGFDYADDPDGTHTPLDSHIRKTNPRDDAVFRDRGHKMLRRGIPFGPRYDAEPGAERGMLFSAYMASIEDQFEFVQRHWVNNPRFPASDLARHRPGRGYEHRVDGKDRVTGDNQLVVTTGAVYAFSPSIPALRRLAGSDPLAG